MTSYVLVILMFFARVTYPCQHIKIGLLLPRSARYAGFPDASTSGGAVRLATEEVYSRYGVNVTILQRDTQCNDVVDFLMGYDLVNLKVDAIVGPVCAISMDFVTRIVAYLSPTIPTFTWLPRRQSNSYPNGTAISTYGTFSDITESLILVLKQFSWSNIGIISSKDELCMALIETINAQFPNRDLDILRLFYIESFSNQSISDALQEVEDHARIIIVCMPPKYLKSLLLKADILKMKARGFIFIYCRFGPSPDTNLLDVDANKRDQVLSPLLQLGLMAMNKTYFKDFEQKAKNTTEVDEFAMSLYDTILLVADLYLNTTHGACLNDTVVNGSILHRTFRSLETVDAVGKISRKISLFHYQNGGFATVGHLTNSYDHVGNIDWPSGSVPLDFPQCGWDNNNCSPEGDSSNMAIIGSCVAIAVLLIVAAVFYMVYRKSKFEKELLSMIWKINRNEIKMRRPRANTQNSLLDRNNTVHPKRKLVRMETRGTLGLGSTSSIDKTVLFAPVGNYKGSIVAVKNIQRRSVNLTREVLRDLKTLRELQHENLNPFIGVSLEPGNSYILTKYCAKGSLQDVLENDDIKLDHMFNISFLMDLARGLDFLHKSPVKSHGNLKSCNCVIDSRWVLKLTDFGAINNPQEDEPHTGEEENEYYNKLLWTAPEILRMQKRPPKGTQKGDVFSFSIIMSEILLRCPPYYFNHSISNKTIINRLRHSEDPPFRPRLSEDVDIQQKDKMVNLMTCCWQDNPDSRPDLHNILKLLIAIHGRRKINIMDNMIMMLEAYSNNLEELVANRTEELAQEKQKTDRLLYQMLPPLVAEQLKRGEHVVPETYNASSLFFSDIVGFTSISSSSTPLQVIDLLNDLYTTFDEIIGMHDVYKVETIGDAYMVASGIPRRNGQRHAGEIANMALDLLSAVTSFRIRHMPDAKLQLRIGLHTGPCAAGVVGLTMPRYCLFGDTVNMASRMESTGKAFHIHVSSDFSDVLQELDWGFQLLERGVIEVKGKGLQKTYWLIGKRGFTSTLPEEVEMLQTKYNESVEKGRPLSPTDTHISSSSLQESTSMYGNAFRRASIAVSFMCRLSQSSRDNSPSGSKLTVRDLDTLPDGQCFDNGVFSNNLNINEELKPNYGLKLPSAASGTKKHHDGSGSSNSPTHGRKKKRSKRKHKERQEKEDGEGKPNNTSLQIPTIEITPQPSI